ncbi:leukocyte immunoglobulin-like receptor subfamily B member 3 [Pangasianodon hypophthalmus]|uniref:leukocyte immunoglobulin-like receptor subfamily B member 3 n=1 Tax=Pangasianodon hypophthalmus TaxID=310915 RepID=UPI0023073E56|nr:leukocyte immunoglobulin-like receptor subfamily B member 3 [Pangasianodon hypophthalmus]
MCVPSPYTHTHIHTFQITVAVSPVQSLRMPLCGFFFTSLLICSAHFLQTCAGGALGQETPPSPELVQVSSGVSSGVVLRCRAPPGHGGRVFQLYRLRTLTGSQQFDTERSHADFQLSTSAADTEIYCCRYDHSMYSPYTHVQPPPRPTTPPAPPQLSVTPPDGRVRPGQVLEFHCQAPPTLAPVKFVLQKQRWETEDVQVVSQSANPRFRVGPVNVADGGRYTCFYTLHLSEGDKNSAPSAPVSVHVGGPTTPPAPPQLSVTPPDGRVRPGQVLEFHCQAPPTLAPVKFVLQKQRWETEDVQVVSQSANPRFRVGPVNVADGGRYTCFYTLHLSEGDKNSAPSAPVSVHVGVELPAPRLSHGKEGALVCTGSPSYPGAYFSLFQQGSSSPLATRPAQMIQHSVQFAASGQHGEGGGYQCQYSVQLGKTWAHSELSTPIILPCVTGSPSCSPPSTDNYPPRTGSMDLPLVCGSVSAALLFLMVLIFLAFGIRKYAERAAKNRRQREQEQFWQQVHCRDHIVDLTLQRVSTGYKEDGEASVSEPIYDCPLSTFTRPPDY